MRIGLTIVGIIIIIIGIIIFVIGFYIQSIQSSNVQQCESFTGELEQFFSSENSDICQRAPSLIMISSIGTIAGIAVIAIGGILSAVGATKSHPHGLRPQQFNRIK